MARFTEQSSVLLRALLSNSRCPRTRTRTRTRTRIFTATAGMYGHSAVYDEGTRCLYVFGGYRYVPPWGAETHTSEQYGARVVLSGDLHALCRPPASPGAGLGASLGAGASLPSELWTWHVLESKLVRRACLSFRSKFSSLRLFRYSDIILSYRLYRSHSFPSFVICTCPLVCAGSECARIPCGARSPGVHVDRRRQKQRARIHERNVRVHVSLQSLVRLDKQRSRSFNRCALPNAFA